MNPPGRYVPWITLRCEHAYFADGVCRALSVHAGAGAVRTLAGLGLRLRAGAGSATLYYLDSGGAPRFDPTAPLALTLESSDTALMQYTDAGHARGSDLVAAVWYFDSRGHADGLLNPDGSSSALLRLALMPRRFCWRLATPQLVSRQAIRGIDDQLVLEKTFASPVKRSGIEFDLGDLADGRYTLLVNGEERLDFFLSDAAPGRIWGAVLLYLDDASAGQAYRISLLARSLRWRYLVVAASAPPASAQYAVVRASDEQAGAFAAAAPRRIDGRPVQVFESRVALPLCERPGPAQRFALHRTGDGRTASRALPCAAADNLVDGFFDMYVYV